MMKFGAGALAFVALFAGATLLGGLANYLSNALVQWPLAHWLWNGAVTAATVLLLTGAAFLFALYVNDVMDSRARDKKLRG